MNRECETKHPKVTTMKHITLTAMVLLLTGYLAWSQCNPMIDLGGAANVLCESDNTNYNLAITGTNIGLSAGTWSGWSEAGNGGATSAMFNPATEGPGIYTITWTVIVADGDCMLNEITPPITIVVDGDNSNLQPTATYSPVIGCIGNPIQIFAMPTTASFSTPTFNYSIDPVNTNAPGASIDLNGEVNATGSGNVVVVITEVNDCNTSLPLSFAIPYGEDPDLVFSPANEIVCDGQLMNVLLTTNYINPGVVQFWLTDIVYSSPEVNNPTSLLTPGPIGNLGTSFFLPGAVLNESVENIGNEPQTITYKFIPTRQDGDLCEGDEVELVVTVLPTPKLDIIANQIFYCSGETLDFSVSTPTLGGGVTFDLVIEESEDPTQFPADLEDDQTFPIIIPELVVTVGGALEVSDHATFILNKTGNFDPGRILIGMQNIRLTDNPTCTAANVPPALAPNQIAVIFPEPVLNDIPDFDICANENTALDISMVNTLSVSTFPNVGYPIKVEWTVETTNNDGGITGASSGSLEIYDENGLELSLIDIDQALVANGNLSETATYKIVPISSGYDGVFGTTADCIGDTLMVNVTVNPDLVVMPNPLNQQICTNNAFEVEMTSNITPINGINDLEYLVTAITNTPSLGQGTTVIPDTTVLQNGQYLTELLVNNTNAPQSVIYTIRPQLNSSRTDVNDPTTATCFGAEVDITVDVYLQPLAGVFDSGSTPFCLEDTKTVTGMPIGNAPFTHLWEIVNPPPAGYTGTGTLDGAQSSTNVAAEFIGESAGFIQLQYIATDADGCSSEPQFLDFEIEALPNVEILGGDLSICIEDGVVSITGTPSINGGTYTTDAPAGLTDLGNGSAEFDPSLSGIGVFELIFDFAPPGACAGSDTIQIEVIDCQPEVSIIDPCACREENPGAQGNATTLENGQFTETVQVMAQPGQTWYIVSVAGLYDIASPHPPFPLIPFQTGPAGDLLIENPAGIFTLQGVHVDEIGYEIIVSNGTDELTISNTCAYPNPKIEDLKGGYCLNANPIPLIGHADPSTGIGTFDIYNSGGIIVHSNATEINPNNLGLGTYDLIYTFDEDDDPTVPCQNCNPGCVQSIEASFKIVDAPNGLTCNSIVNVSLDDDCEVIVHPDMVLEGTYPSYDIFTVEIFEFSQALGDTVTGAQIGQLLSVKVFEECGGNHCWGTMMVEDKLGPVFNCQDTIQVSCAADIDLLLPPTAVDNCDGNISPVLLGESVQSYGCGNANDIVRSVLRVWRAVDSNGNQGQDCSQIIEYEKSDLSDVVFPLSYDDNDLPSFDCTDFETEPDSTGWPTLGGFPLDSSNFCSMNVLYDDDVVQICEGSFKIIRTWTVFDWCASSSADNPITHNQIIKILDKTAPSLICPNDLTVGMLGDCASFGSLPAAAVTDDCSSNAITVSVFTPSGNILGNGGILVGLDLGFHTVTYQASDDCDNTSTCDVNVQVVDNVPPTPICDEFTIVSLNSAGLTYNDAISFDDGSYDNCDHLPLTFDAKRMDDPGDFADKVGFDCSDVGAPIQVIVRVTDYFGNENLCMVTVDVQSKNSPFIVCPPAVTIDCTDNLNDYNLTLQPTIGGNCNIVSNLPTNEDHIDAMCGTGSVIRTWTVVDEVGETASCTQLITITDANLFDSTGISWPLDTTISGCQTTFEIEPQNLPVTPLNYSMPIIDYEGCGIDPVPSHLDQYFTVTDSACFKVVRTWTVIDWCQHVANDPNSAGIWSYQQVIKIVDDEAPILTNCDDREFDNETNDCSPIVVDLSINVEDCADSLDLVISWEVDEFNDGSINDFGLGMNTSNAYPNGAHRIVYTVNDKCGNSESCEFIFTIVDGQNPTISCASLNIEIMPASGMIDVPVNSLLFGVADNCSDTIDLQISYSANVNDTIMTFTCDEIGSNTIEIWVTDEAGNQDLCITQLNIQDNMMVCDDDTLVVVSGGIFNEDDFPINGVNVSVNSTTSISTGQNGVFTFNDLPGGGDYSITPEKDDDLLNGVTTYDMALISKHVLNVKKLDSPYKMIAADVNNSGAITTMDLVHLRKAILHINDFFPDNRSWRFIENEYEFPDSDNPFFETIPEVINYNNLTQNAIENDFIGIKIGDVNGSANPSSAQSLDDRNSFDPFYLKTNDQLLEKGKDVVIDFYPEKMESLEGFQFTLQFDPNKVTFIDILETDLMNRSNFGLTKLEEGVILVSWNQSNIKLYESDKKEPLFGLILKSKEKVLLSHILGVNSQVLKTEAYLSNRDSEIISNLKIKFENEDISDKLILYQNRPNPFRNSTLITFNNPNSEYVTLKIMDYSGKVIEARAGFFEKGMHVFEIDWTDRPETGIFIYQFESSTSTSSKKMVRTH